MAVITQDGFTRAANALLSAHTPDTVGQTWVLVGNTNSATLTVRAATDDVAATASAASSYTLYASKPNPSTQEYDVQITCKTTGPTGTDDPWQLLARCTDIDNSYLAGTYQAGNTADKKITMWNVGGSTELASGDFGLTAGDVFKFEVRNAAKKLFQNGVERLSTTNNVVTGAQCGIGMGVNFTASADDVDTSWVLDDYLAQDPPGAAAGSVSLRRRGAVKFVHMIVR